MSSPCTPDSDIADWLATIHLERYRNLFKQHGFHLARDVSALDNKQLQQLGITATGHRKRILNLAEKTRLLGYPHPRAPQMGEDAAKAEPGAAADAFGMQQCSAMPSQSVPPQKDLDPPLVRPVPKPRTVFYRPKLEQGSAAIPPAHSPDRDRTAGAFVVLEGFVPGESSTDLESPGATMGTGTSRLGAREEARLPTVPDHGETEETPEKPCLCVPSVPPRLRHRAPVAEITTVGTTGRPPSVPGVGQGRMEMVSNVIYEGLKSPLSPVEDSGQEDSPQGQAFTQDPSPQELTQLDEKSK